MKKTLSILLCVVFLLTWMPLAQAAQEDPIRISSLEEFLTFAENCRMDSYSAGKTFLLTVDIELTGTDFTGIPVFCGTFDGAYHTISGLDLQKEGSYRGLFRHILAGATVGQLKVAGRVEPSGSRSTVGGIAGTNAGTIENCCFTGTVTAASYAGGIVGINQPGGLILNCSSEGTVSAYHFSGGIAGSNEGTIRTSINQAGVNLTPQQNQIGIGDITIDTIIDTESVTAATDIGGIAGISTGVILGCTNRGTVGYAHMGYNVGGIVGMQCGYVAGCENYGQVFGRKEVGGIAGQQEPQVIVRYDADTTMILKAQLAELSARIDRATANAESNSAAIRKLIRKIEKHTAKAEDAIEYLSEALRDPKWEDLQKYADALTTIREALEGIQTCLDQLADALDATTDDLTKDMEAISEQLDIIEDTLDHADAHLGGQIFDISDQDTGDDTGSKIENCNNFGTVSADLNAGGIVGAIVFENDLDPEQDISVLGDATLNAVGSLRSVIRNCANTALVQVKNQRVGGIVGWLTLGLVTDCVHSGKLDNPGASYVGGIAGQSAGYLRNCQVKSVISGADHVGGIAGSGSMVSNCYAMVQLQGGEFAGGILGEALEANRPVEDPIVQNYYLQLGTDTGAIDGISYAGMAQGLGQEAFFIQAGNDLFDKVHIRFYADGEMVLSLTQNVGTALQKLPSVPQKDGCTGRWQGIEEVDLNCIFFDLQIQAEYIRYSATISSDLTDQKGRPILLFQGDFALDADAVLTPIETPAALAEGQTWLQGWNFVLRNSVGLTAGRLLLPVDANTETLMLLVREEGGKWSQRPYSISGSYAVFSLAETDEAVALIQCQEQKLFNREVVIAGCVGALTALLIVIPFVVIHSKKKRAVSTSSEATTES